MTELERIWRKSSYSGSESACVEVKITDDGVLVRDTKDRSKPAHSYTHPEWRAFIAGAKDGEFDI
ncbi:MAG: DUF397 domain-containing protein [Pseudonocardiaceae bacterium]